MEKTGKTKKVIIIGGGIAGLSAGSYLVRNGFDVEIFEMHQFPGGQCTSWKKGKFTFDGCLHWLVGSKPGGYLHNIWKELGALEGTEILDHDIYMELKYPGEKTLTLYTDPEKLEKEMKRFAPEDTKEIQRFIKTLQKFIEVKMIDPPGLDQSSFFTKIFRNLRFFWQIGPLLKWARIDANDYAKRFTNRDMAEAVRSLFSPEFAMLFNFFTLAWLAQKNAGYPLGGSLKFSQKIADHYEKLGGVIHTGKKVTRIMVDSGKAAGVVLENNKTIASDYVISASDGINTVENLLQNKYHNPKIKKAWQVLPLFNPLLYISLGIDGDLEMPDAVSGTVAVLDRPLDTGHHEIHKVLIHSLGFDPTMAPKGKTSMSLMCETGFDFWNNLRRKDEKEYRKMKQVVTDEVLKRLEDLYFPGLRRSIETIDIATPTTWVHYTGVYRGSFEGLQLSKEAFSLGMSLPKTLEGLNNFYLCGQWVEPGGGVPAAAMSGKNVAAAITKKEGKKFIV